MRAIHVQLSDEAYDQWNAFADTHGLTLSALIEAVALHIPEWSDEWTQRVVGEARAIASERRRKRR